METLLKHYRIDAVWHFTDRSNLESIQKNHGLLSLAELRRRGVEISAPGGNEWSHEADEIKGVHEFVHLSFIDDHPMLFRAKQESRILNPVWIKIDASILLEDGVCFTVDVSNKSGVQMLTPEVARALIDFEVLFTYMDWKDPDIKARRSAAVKSEILIPTIVPIKKILGVKNG